jgi:hypothetical protein
LTNIVRSRTASEQLNDEPASRFLFQLWLTTVLFLAGIALVATAVLMGEKVPVHDDAFYAQFCLLKAAFYPPQPVKNSAYIFVCLAVPFLLSGSYFLSRILVEKIPRDRLTLSLRYANIANGLFFVWCLWPMVYCPVPAMQSELPDWLAYTWFFEGRPVFTFPRVVLFGMALALGWYFRAAAPSSKNRKLAFLIVGVTWLLIVVTRFYVPAEINDEWRFTHHFNPLVFGLSQVGNGRHYLDFPHRYGGYIEFLAPIVSFFPRRLGTILVLFGLLNVGAMAALLLSLRLLIRSPLQLLLAGWALLGILAVDAGDNYYQNAVVRELFPALGLLAAVAYLRRPGFYLYGLVTVLSVLAPLWNQESGMILWVSWTATLIVREISAGSFRKIGLHLAIQALALVGAVAKFAFYLRMVSGHWPDPNLLFVSNYLFIGLGYFCLRMLVPDAWMLVAAIYAMGLAAVIHLYWRRAFSWRTHALFMICLMSIGFFSYFTARSAESNLVDVAWLVPVLVGLVLSETGELIASKQLSGYSWMLLWPVIAIQVWWALLFVLALPTLTAESVAKLSDLKVDLSGTPFGKNVAFVQSQAEPSERLFILSDQAGFYYYLSDTISELPLGSTDEFIWNKDIDGLVAAIDSRQIPKLFVDKNFFETRIYNDDVYDRLSNAIAQSYRLEAVSPSERVMLYVPR